MLKAPRPRAEDIFWILCILLVILLSLTAH
jgi:hypothetical protein